MRRYDGWLPCSLNKHKGLRGCIVACSCGAPLRRQDTRVHGAGGAPRQAQVMVSEGVWCLKVYDIISGPDRWQGSGVSPAAGGKIFLGLVLKAVHSYTHMYFHTCV